MLQLIAYLLYCGVYIVRIVSDLTCLIKIIYFNLQCRDRGVTMLVRVDVCAAEGGVLVVNVSHQAAGFAPYRLDNCSSETLHLRSAIL